MSISIQKNHILLLKSFCNVFTMKVECSPLGGDVWLTECHVMFLRGIGGIIFVTNTDTGLAGQWNLEGKRKKTNFANAGLEM